MADKIHKAMAPRSRDSSPAAGSEIKQRKIKKPRTKKEIKRRSVDNNNQYLKGHCMKLVGLSRKVTLEEQVRNAPLLG